MKDKMELSGYTFCKIKLVYVSCVEVFNGSQPVSSYCFVAPVEIRAASSCIFMPLP